MMVLVFALATAALALAYLGRAGLALASGALCLGVAIGLFLFEVYSPTTGFGMPSRRRALCGADEQRGACAPSQAR